MRSCNSVPLTIWIITSTDSFVEVMLPSNLALESLPTKLYLAEIAGVDVNAAIAAVRGIKNDLFFIN